ncbi:hypothetical protein AAGW05_06230 [Arthrobacter sp. LAPM80]|uniref:hypothetical protein n=1 Tax=Arthrobacter sp. LAPM80 TaxID=3141788 RepID=UPI00398B82D5
MREQLLASTFWGIRRPKVPLAQGHFLLRLNDPSIAFGAESAADLLRCYGHLRRAMTDLAGATAAQLYIALNWHPVGDAVGEPLPETSTPTVHAFFSWPGSTTAASALRLPAHQRVAVGNTEGLDERLRVWGGGLVSDTPGGPTPGPDRAWEPPGWADRPFHIEPVGPAPGESFRGGHWSAVARFPAATLDGTDPLSLLALAKNMTVLASHSRPPFQGVTLWVTEEWPSPVPAVIHLFARRHGEEPQQIADFVAGGGLDLPLSQD